MKTLVITGVLLGSLFLPHLASAKIEMMECLATHRGGPGFAAYYAKKCVKNKCNHAGGEVRSKSLAVSRWYVSFTGWRSHARLACYFPGSDGDGIESFGEDTED